MKILFIGTFGKKWSTHYPIFREFKKKNNDIIKFDFRALPLKYKRIKSSIYSKRFKFYFDSFINLRLYLPNKIKSIKYYLFGNWRMNRLLLYMVKKFKFDLVFLAKTDNINYKIIPKLNKFSNTYYYFMDPLNVSYQINAHKYAALCTWCSASTTAMTNLFKKSGGNSFYVLEGYDNEIFSPGPENKNKEIDVIFVGYNLPNRREYIDYLKKTKINVICYGHGWENKPIYLDELVKIYRKSKIILNFPRADSGFSDRVFQVMGIGSFMLSKYCSDLPRVFKKGEHMDWFKDPEECLKLVKYYLANNDERKKISQEGHQFALNNFTWGKRVEKIINIIKKNKK